MSKHITLKNLWYIIKHMKECPKSPTHRHMRGAGAAVINNDPYEIESRCFYCNQALAWNKVYE